MITGKTSDPSRATGPAAPPIPGGTMLDDIAGVPAGNLEGYPFALLLLSYARREASLVLELKHNQVKKTIFFDKGQPVQCESNIQHESFGAFLVDRKIVTPQQQHECLTEAARENVRLSEILLRRQLIAPFDLFKMLQQNLAFKLLDAFNWTTGAFSTKPLTTGVVNPLNVNVPQLLLAALNRLDAFPSIEQQVRRLAKRPLELNPEVLWTPEDLKLNAKQSRVMALLRTVHNLADLEQQSPLDHEALYRFIYAMAFLGVVVPDSFAPTPASTIEINIREGTALPPRGSAVPVTAPPAPQPSMASSMPDGMAIDALLHLHTDLNNRDAFELLEIGVHADLKEIREAFLARACTHGPWCFNHPDAGDLQEKAADVFIAMARAYTTLENPETRMLLIQRKQTPAHNPAAAATPRAAGPRPVAQPPQPAQPVAPPRPQPAQMNHPDTPIPVPPPVKAAARNAFAIKTDLLDPVKQYRIGVKLMEAERFDEALEYVQLAHDLDESHPQFRSELIYCHFKLKPSLADKALDELNALVREHPGCHICHFHLGELHRHVGNRTAAETCYKKAIAGVKKDNRPKEALRTLLAGKR